MCVRGSKRCYNKVMKQDNKITGATGERAAAELLRKKGYEILERNFQTKFGEIDIVAKPHPRGERSSHLGGVTVFVEVKTKTSDEFGEPWEMVNQYKLEQVKRMGELWNIKNNWQGQCRIDVVGVWLKEGQVDKIEHWKKNFFKAKNL
ncbi:MAG: hypothetical protein UV54_C0015G0002 [Candidatus Beckwithbacteria bacterium GW2011_GWA2_43_10]|uniref:UPF0102 protein UV54_C0015G0002 n=1 Tax=Candidatus Beckwithbacteria bacterium GW2011_GWA2_43_10 TaxID=1618369 RepID=A0A0G1C3Z0_9BACT|nr:MAG: hypothetical protein UV54_C0015G0002 [Candidatus Beckwithbacteria bacterium GW2011_GWA2_43_10]